MTEYHSKTEHSYKSIRMNSGFLNWSSQPSTFKHYPHFYPRFKLDAAKEFDDLILLCGKVTYEKKYGNESYYLRIQPSAGALFPTELYVQIRNVHGWIDGIYHFEPLEENLILLYELNGDGIESVAGVEYEICGAVFLISSPYFRSSWKYKNRAFRYCLLDSGHVYGALEFSAYAHDTTCEAIFEFDKLAIADFFGFENKELPILMAICGEKREKTVKKPQLSIPFVPSTDYFEPNGMVEDAFRDTLAVEKSSNKNHAPNFEMDKTLLKNAVVSRRSIRAFYKQPITLDEFWQIKQIADESVNSVHDESLEIFFVVNNVTSMQTGIYKGDALVQSGDFRSRTGYLCLEQALGMDSSVTFFVTADTHSYQSAMILAGIFGHRLYIGANMLNIGASGIGAYYDADTKDFLGTTNEILYAIAIGR